jgi:hypothetical protein
VGEDIQRIRTQAKESNDAVRGMSVDPGMQVDGDVIEQLARAHERHAERLLEAVQKLEGVGRVNHLGDTGEGRTATANYRASAVSGPNSFASAVMAQATVARQIATQLRETIGVLSGADADNAVNIGNART